MSWLFYAIAARFFWACCNFLDQYTARYSGHNSAFGFLIVSHIFLFPIIIALALFMGHPVLANPASLIWLGAGVVFCMIGLFPYLLALQSDEAYNVIPLFELIPVFVTLLAYPLFGDKLVGRQLVGAALVVTSGYFFSWDFKRGHIRLRTVGLMVLASLFYALYQLSLRYGAQRESVWHIAFWLSTGFFATALIIFIAASGPRRLFVKSVRQTRGKILAVAFGQNLSDFAATVAIVTAYAKAPGAGYVAALSGTQSLFILLISVILGLTLPRHYPRLAWDRGMQIKCLLILVIAGGIVLLKSG